MTKILPGLVAAAFMASTATPALAAQTAPVSRSDEAARVAEAQAIIAIMYPPATRGQMLDKMLTDLTAPLRKNMPYFEDIKDPGLKAIFKDFMDQTFEGQRPLMAKYLPTIMDAMAAAYSRKFSLAELKDVRAFAESPSGRIYFSSAVSVMGDPAVQKVTADMMTDAQQSVKARTDAFKDKLVAYIKDHPAAADELKAMAESSGSAK